MWNSSSNREVSDILHIRLITHWCRATGWQRQCPRCRLRARLERQEPAATPRGNAGRSPGPSWTCCRPCCGTSSGMRSAVVSSAVLSIDARSKACRLLLSSGRFERAREADAITRSSMRMRAAKLATAGVSSLCSRRKSARAAGGLREPHSWPTGVRIEGRRLKPW